MAKQKAVCSTKKNTVTKMPKAHRFFVLTMFSLLLLFMLAAMIYVIASSKLNFEITLMLLSILAFLFLPFPLYYATWQITFDADGIQKRLFGFHYKKYAWTQIKEVRSAWLISERSNVISIILKDKKTIRFRMDCDNAEQAKKIILSHCSIKEQGV